MSPVCVHYTPLGTWRPPGLDGPGGTVFLCSVSCPNGPAAPTEPIAPSLHLITQPCTPSHYHRERNSTMTHSEITEFLQCIAVTVLFYYCLVLLRCYCSKHTHSLCHRCAQFRGRCVQVISIPWGSGVTFLVAMEGPRADCALDSHTVSELGVRRITQGTGALSGKVHLERWECGWDTAHSEV